MSTIASHSPLNISKTVRDRGLVPIPKDHQWKMACAESNGHVTARDRWRHVTPKIKLVTTICL